MDHRQQLDRWMDVGLIDEACRPGSLLWHPYGWLCPPYQGPITSNHRRTSPDFLSGVGGEPVATLPKGPSTEWGSGVRFPGNMKEKRDQWPIVAKVLRESRVPVFEWQCKKPR